MKNIQNFMDDDDYKNRGKVLADSILTVLRNEDWKNVRNTITPAFTAGKMKFMIPIINESLKTLEAVFEAKIAENSPSFNVKEIFGAFTLEVIAAVAFATQTNCQQNPNDILVKMARRIFEITLKNPLVILGRN